MLIDLADLYTKYNMDITGVLHVGAHVGEEAEKYHSLGIRNVVWVEANPDTLGKLEATISRYSGQWLIQAVVSDTDGEEVTFRVTNDPEGTTMSSSILELGVHKIHAPWVVEVEQKRLTTSTIDTLVYERGVHDCNFLNLDIQGAELLALKGATEFLKSCDYIYTEINSGYVYKDCALFPEIDDFLAGTFSRLETSMTKAEWGDALYVRDGLV